MTSQLITSRTYGEVRDLMLPGDLIAFGGNSLFSRWTKLTTRSSVTHVAVVTQSQLLGDNSGRYFNQVIEATTYKEKSGVQTNRLSDRLRDYDGDIWWLPLHSAARTMLEQNKVSFFDFLYAQRSQPYDVAQLFGCAVDALDDIPLLRALSYNSEDFSSWFCSELIIQAYEEASLVNNVNASEVSPIDVCRFNLYAGEYVQLKGEPRAITGINSLHADGWGY